MFNNDFFKLNIRKFYVTSKPKRKDNDTIKKEFLLHIDKEEK